MRVKTVMTVVLAVALILAGSIEAAQAWKGWKGSGGWGPGTQYSRMYDTATVETVAGVIEDIQTVVPFKGMYSGVQAILKTDKETIAVHLGPAWYIERIDMKIEKGNKIEVKGSRTTFAGKPAIIASEVKKGDEVLVLRDANGIPVWAGWRR